MFAQDKSAQNDSTAAQPGTPAGKRLLGVGMLTVGIAAGAMFAPVSFAGAQDDGDDATEAESSRDGHRDHRGEVLQSLGIDGAALRAGIEADQSLAQIAEASGVSEADLIAAIEADIENHIAQAVESGRLTQEVADAKLADLTATVTERVSTVPSERPERGARGRLGGGEVLEELGLSVEDVRAGRQAGQTLAETAAASGVSEADLVDALVARATERAEAALEEGRIDADRAAEILDGLDDRITERVNTEPSERSERGPRGQRGSGGDVEDAAASF